MSQLIAGASLDVARFVATEEGYGLLERRPELMSAVSAFALGVYPRAEDALNSNVVGDGLTHLYASEITETTMIGGIAVEMSTGSTGRNRWKTGYSRLGSGARSPLFRQFLVLNALAAEIGTDRYSNVFVPEQLFAFETHNGNSLVASVFPDGFLTLAQWLKKHVDSTRSNVSGPVLNADDVLFRTAERVRRKVADSTLKMISRGLLDSAGFHVGDTMLVADYLPDPNQSGVGITRLPSRRQRVSGYVAERIALTSQTNANLKHSSPIFEPSPQI